MTTHKPVEVNAGDMAVLEMWYYDVDGVHGCTCDKCKKELSNGQN